MTELAAYEVVVVGAGPAGLAAAAAAGEVLDAGRVALLDDNPAPGGQIWRHGRAAPAPALAAASARVNAAGVALTTAVSVVDAHRLPAGDFLLLGDKAGAAWGCRAGKVVLATGASELFLPFPGWTLPGVYGAGGLQALVKSGFELRGRRLLVAGSGPLLLAVAQAFRRHGGQVLAIAEQAPRQAVLRFAARLPLYPRKWLQALGLGLELLPLRQLYSAWPLRAEGEGRLERVVLSHGGREEVFECDLLACGFGLLPALPLPRLLGCVIAEKRVEVDELLQTSVPGVYAAGESLGIGGVVRAELDGTIAGLAAAGAAAAARRYLPRRRREQRFAADLAATYRLREELRELVHDSTLVCRCEDVSWGEIRRCPAARDAKLKTRAGMGPCQGRVCGGALEFLTGWQSDAVRPPLFPVSGEVFAELARLAASVLDPDHQQPSHPG